MILDEQRLAAAVYLRMTGALIEMTGALIGMIRIVERGVNEF
jgi:hypothetical protein